MLWLNFDQRATDSTFKTSQRSYLFLTYVLFFITVFSKTRKRRLHTASKHQTRKQEPTGKVTRFTCRHTAEAAAAHHCRCILFAVAGTGRVDFIIVHHIIHQRIYVNFTYVLRR